MRQHTIHVKRLHSLAEKTQGLLGKDKAEAIFFRTHFGIHTFLMEFPIDVIILDDDFCVVKLKENLTPNSIFLWNPTYKNVLELPHGTIKKEKININQTIRLSFTK